MIFKKHHIEHECKSNENSKKFKVKFPKFEDFQEEKSNFVWVPNLTQIDNWLIEAFLIKIWRILSICTFWRKFLLVKVNFFCYKKKFFKRAMTLACFCVLRVFGTWHLFWYQNLDYIPDGCGEIFVLCLGHGDGKTVFYKNKFVIDHNPRLFDIIEILSSRAIRWYVVYMGS